MKMLGHPGRLHQSPAQLTQKLKSITVDWAVGLHRNRDKFILWWQSSILDHLVRCCQLGCIACLARISFQMIICSCARHRHIPYERPARAPRNQRQPIWAFSVWTTKARWFLGHRDASWGKGSCWHHWDGGALSAWCSCTNKNKDCDSQINSDPQRHW